MRPSTPSRPAAVVRSLLAALLAVLAGAGFAAWLGLSWVQEHLLSPSGFQDTTASVVVDTGFQDELVSTLLERATPDALEDFRTGFGPVDDAVRRLRETATDAVHSWATAPEQQDLWIRILNDTHDANIPLAPTAGQAPATLVVDVGALGQEVEHQVQERTGFSPGIDEQSLRITVPGARTGGLVDALVWCAQWRYALPWLAAGCAVAAVATAPRRWLALAGVGLAGVACTGVLLGVVLSSAQTVVEASAVDPVAHLVTERIASVLRESFVERGVTGMVGAGVVALAGVVGAVVRVRAVTYH